ncbi:MAG TPA: hypothetical protein VK390_14545 [Propionibacteriaceae bacterium]|nr:hypothetical protein [Propionibacteriaceae bacterium]
MHSWSATPTKDLVWYGLGVTPAEPGYGTVRVALASWRDRTYMAGSVPTSHGLLRVSVEGGDVRVDSPVPGAIRVAERGGVLGVGRTV